MATKFGVGFSNNIDISEAAREASFQARANCASRDIHAAIVLNTIHYNPEEFLPVIRDILRETKIIGCSTAGIILSQHIGMRGLAVLAIHSDESNFAVSSVSNIDTKDMHDVGTNLAKTAIHDFGQQQRKAFIYFADGLLADNSLILKGLQEVFGSVFPILGAGSSDDFYFKKTYQYCQDQFMNDAVTGILMGGRLNIGLGSRHGWRPLGKPRIIDKVEGNVIRKIDGKPAASIYDEYFGEHAENLRSMRLGQMSILYPLGIYVPGEREYLLRNAVKIIEDGSIVCQGEVPAGAEVHIMIGNKESCIQAAADAALEAQYNLLGKKAHLVIIVESFARHKLLGRMAFQEVQTIKEIFGQTTPIFGMYSYGEISPSETIKDMSKTHLKNESIAILAIG